MRRRRNLGLAGGSLWLIVISALFAAGSLLVVRSPAATALSVTIAAVALVLVFISIVMLRAVFRVRDEIQPRPSEGRRIWRRFGALVAAEGVALTAATLTCVVTRRWALIAPLDLTIVGLHFLPLARLFDVPRYNITGAMFCGISIVTTLAIPIDGHIGSALSWLVVPSVGCAAVAWITAGAGLREVGRFVHSYRTV